MNKKLLYLLLMFGITISTTQVNAFAIHPKYLPYIAATGAVVGGFFGFTNNEKNGELYTALQKYSGYNWICEKMSKSDNSQRQKQNRIFSAFVSALLGGGAGYGFGWLFLTLAREKMWAKSTIEKVSTNPFADEKAGDAEQIVSRMSGYMSPREKFPYTATSLMMKKCLKLLERAKDYLTQVIDVEPENVECKELLHKVEQKASKICHAKELVNSSIEYSEEQSKVQEELIARLQGWRA